MSGEWIPIDIGLGSKPEVQELVDISGAAVETVVFRLIQMWGWASLNTADGTLRATPARVARICGGDSEFWLAVEKVGWLKFDQEAGTMSVPGWETRFSRAAKARAADRIRKINERQALSGERPGSVRDVSDEIGNTGEQKTVLHPPSSSRERERESGEADDIRKAWDAAAKSGFVKPFSCRDLPAGIWDRLAEPGWAEDANRAIDRLAKCRFFADDPPTFRQFVSIDRKGMTFVDKCLAGEFDSRKKPKAVAVELAGGRPSVEAAADRFARPDPKVAAMVREREEARRRTRA